MMDHTTLNDNFYTTCKISAEVGEDVTCIQPILVGSLKEDLAISLRGWDNLTRVRTRFYITLGNGFWVPQVSSN
jgi:hypothetical protein